MCLLAGPRTISCDFDIDTCLWTQSKTDYTDWILQDGPTSTSRTGPKADHTSGSKFDFSLIFNRMNTF